MKHSGRNPCTCRTLVGAAPFVAEPLEPRYLLSASGINGKLVWSDEFNGNHLDTKKWNVGLAWTGDDGTNRHFSSDWLSYITDNDVVVSDGTLKLMTEKRDVADPSGRVFHYTEGMINSDGRFSMKYGYAEIRAQIPTSAGKGLWPSFWMLNYGWPPEDDVAEWQTSSNRFHQGLAYGGSGNVHWDDTNTFMTPQSGFHTYGMEWGPGYQVFNVDGQITHVSRGNYVPNVPMYLLLNSGVQATQPPNSATVFPNAFEIDYVRVYKQAPGEISNSGFEARSLGAWTGTGGASVVNGNAHTGSFALQTAGAGASAGQVLTGLSPKTSYTLTAWVKTQDSSDAARIGVSGAGGPDVVSAVTSATGYTQLSLTFTTGRGVHQATVEGRQSAGSGDAWFDDFVLHPAGQVENGTLESGSTGWTLSATAAVVVDHPHGGKSALREDGTSGFAQQTLYGLLPDTTYTLNVFAKVSGAGDQATVGITDDGAADAAVQISWTKYRRATLTFTTGNSTTATLFCTKVAGTASAWFDDLKLVTSRR